MKATQKPPVEVQVTPADILRCAAIYLDRHGWNQGGYYATTGLTSSACAVGAVGIATAGHPADHFFGLDPAVQREFRCAVGVLTEYLNEHHPIHFVDDDGFLVDEHVSPYAWNDDPARTAEQVIAALRAAADEWDLSYSCGGAR